MYPSPYHRRSDSTQYTVVPSQSAPPLPPMVQPPYAQQPFAQQQPVVPHAQRHFAQPVQYRDEQPFTGPLRQDSMYSQPQNEFLRVPSYHDAPPQVQPYAQPAAPFGQNYHNQEQWQAQMGYVPPPQDRRGAIEEHVPFPVDRTPMEAEPYISRYPNLDRHGGAYPPSRTMMGRSRGHTKHASLSYAPTYRDIGQENYRFPAPPAPSFNGSHRYSTSTSGGHRDEAYPQAHYQSSAVPRIRVYLSSPSPARARHVSLPSYRGFDRSVRPFYDATNAPTFSGSRADTGSIFGSGNKLRKPRRPMF